MIRVTYAQPSGRIANYVQGIFILEQPDDPSFRLPLFANGTPTLVFHNSDERQTGDPLMLYGQTVLPDKRVLARKSTLIAYYFQPWCLGSLFGLTASELTDNPIDFGLICKDRRLSEKLRNAGSVKQMLSLLDDHIFRQTSLASREDPRIRYAVGRISAEPQKEILVRIQKDIHTTERSFQRIFEKHVGVSPNQYRRIIQFNKAFRQLNEEKFSSLSDIAFDHGYADQSHFNRAFREFTNHTASQYLDSLPEI